MSHTVSNNYIPFSCRHTSMHLLHVFEPESYFGSTAESKKKKGNCIDKVKQHLQDYCLRTYACVYEGVKISLSILHTEPRPIPLYALPALEKQYSARRSGLLYTNRSLFKRARACVCVSVLAYTFHTLRMERQIDPGAHTHTQMHARTHTLGCTVSVLGV